jgi:hypothetical protein
MTRFSPRRSRRFDFDFFARDARAVFHDIAARDARHDALEETYPFYVVPGGRNGGHDRRVVEIFYGRRPFEQVRELVQQERSLPALRDRLLSESGATLLYQRWDNGTVLCTLHPAHSENYRRREEAIVLAVIRNTHVLTGVPTLERHWRAFMSYMQYTALDGEPSATDRLRVWWLLSTRRLVINKTAEVARFWVVAGQLAFFSATVGLSGFLLAFVQWWFAKNPSP